MAVVGGGLFGATAAAVLARDFSVTLIERRRGLLLEASGSNQLRHHLGFHYPRSPRTIREVAAADDSFREFYSPALVPTSGYYAVARKGSKTSPEQFRKRIQAHGLGFRPAFPKPALLNRAAVSLCVRTEEPVYDLERLRACVQKRLRAVPGLKVLFNCEVRGAADAPGGGTFLELKESKARLRREKFDFVVGAVYSGVNEFRRLLGLSGIPLRYQFKELLLLDLGVSERVGVTVVDGPFASLLPFGRTGLFTLGDALLSAHRDCRRAAPAELADWSKARATRWPEIRAHAGAYFPAVLKARRVGSLRIVFPLDPTSTARDDRTTELTDLGKGRFSILAGKMITCVSTARELRDRLKSRL